MALSSLPTVLKRPCARAACCSATGGGATKLTLTPGVMLAQFKKNLQCIFQGVVDTCYVSFCGLGLLHSLARAQLCVIVGGSAQNTSGCFPSFSDYEENFSQTSKLSQDKHLLTSNSDEVQKKTPTHPSDTGLLSQTLSNLPARGWLLFPLIHSKLLVFTSSSATRCSPREKVHLDMLWENTYPR